MHIRLFFQDHGVDKLFWLEPGALSNVQKNIVYLCRPEIGLMRIIAGELEKLHSLLLALPSNLHTIRTTLAWESCVHHITVQPFTSPWVSQRPKIIPIPGVFCRVQSCPLLQESRTLTHTRYALFLCTWYIPLHARPAVPQRSTSLILPSFSSFFLSFFRARQPLPIASVADQV